MINQETLYQLLLKEKWGKILDILYKEKECIKNDLLLNFAAKTFESEFLSKVKNYKIDNKDILENIEKFYLLHHGKFYMLSDENYKILTLEIVKRKPLNEAYNYAKFFPNEKVCQEIIKKYESIEAKATITRFSDIKYLETNWIEIYNKLFELINNQNNTATYFSGPRFIGTVKQFVSYFPNYRQYIDKRNLEGKSTTRKIFYYDILLDLDKKTRLSVINRILEIIEPFEKEKVSIIRKLMNNESFDNIKENQNSFEYIAPVVFISYSWDSEDHKKWVLALSNRLCDDGVNVILDRYYLTPGSNLPHFVEDNLNKANRIIIIFTKNYKLKADKRTGGVGYEYSILNADLYRNQTSSEKIIPILRAGSIEESIPKFMQQFIHIDIRNDNNFENSYNDLIREIFNEPEITKPKIGEKPNFKSPK